MKIDNIIENKKKGLNLYIITWETPLADVMYLNRLLGMDIEIRITNTYLNIYIGNDQYTEEQLLNGICLYQNKHGYHSFEKPRETLTHVIGRDKYVYTPR